MSKNAISWFDVPTADFDRAVKFYSTILGTEIRLGEHMGQTLAFFPCEGPLEEAVGGALVPPGMGREPSAGGTCVFLDCEGKLDDVISRVEPSGGKIVQPKMSIGEPGWIAIIQDSEGNTIGLHSSK
jgi:hypothetical protein